MTLEFFVVRSGEDNPKKCTAMRLAKAGKIKLIAFLTLLQRMIRHKTVKMHFLLGAEYAGPAAEGTGTVKGSQDGIPDKFGAIGDALHGLQQGGIGLESNNFFFYIFHGNPQNIHALK